MLRHFLIFEMQNSSKCKYLKLSTAAIQPAPKANELTSYHNATIPKIFKLSKESKIVGHSETLAFTSSLEQLQLI